MEQQSSPPNLKYLNLALILLAVCLLAVFMLRARMETEPDWRIMQLRKDNLFVQHPIAWLAGDCYAHGRVLDALADAASALKPQELPVIVFRLSSRHADADNTGTTADIGFVARTPNGRPSQAAPSLLTYGPTIHYDAKGEDNGIVSAVIDPAATLQVLDALVNQPMAQVERILVPPFAIPLLKQASDTLPAAEAARLFALMKEDGERNASMRFEFRLPGSPSGTVVQ
ncbi:MAG: hypothetical protein ACK5JO_00320 [Halodesulfovibrio sp.]